MSVQTESRWKLIGLASLILLVPVFLFGAPPEWFYGQSYTTPVGIITAIGVWIVPTLLSGFALYYATQRGVTIRSVIMASLGGVTLVNLRTTALSGGGLLTYEGRGTFFGPFVSLLTGCLLALTILFDAFGEWISPRTGSIE